MLGQTLEGSLLDGLVLRRDHGDTEWVTLADRQAMPQSLVQDQDYVCWSRADPADFAVRCVAKEGGPVFDVARTTLRQPHLALENRLLAWTDAAAGRVMALDLPDP